MRTPALIASLAAPRRLVRRLLLAAKLYLRLRYTWRLAWHKAAR